MGSVPRLEVVVVSLLERGGIKQHIKHYIFTCICLYICIQCIYLNIYTSCTLVVAYLVERTKQHTNYLEIFVTNTK